MRYINNKQKRVALPRKALHITLPLAVALLIGACSDDQLSEVLSAAERAEATNDRRAIIFHYQRATQIDPRNGFVRWRLGKAMLGVRNGAAAEAEIRIAADLGVDANRIKPALAQALFLQDKHQQVVDIDDEGLDQTHLSTLLAYQARAYLALDQSDAATDALQRANALSPYAPDVAFAQAEWLVDRGDWLDALDSLKTVQMVDPEYIYLPGLQGRIAEMRLDLPQAETHYSVAVENYGDHWRDRLARARVRMALGMTDTAAADIRHLLERMPNDAGVLLLASRVYAKTGKQARAIDFLNQLLKHEPNNFGAAIQLARLELERGGLERAQQAIATAQRLDADHIDTRLLEGELLLQRGDADAAAEQFRAIYVAHPESLKAQRLLAMALLQQQQFDQAAQNDRTLAGLLTNDDDAAEVKDAAALLGTEQHAQGVAQIAAMLDGQATGKTESTDTTVTQTASPTTEPTRSPQSLVEQAFVRFDNGDEQAANVLLNQALSQDPANLDTLNALVALDSEGKTAIDVAQAIDDALRLEPDSSDLLALKANLAETRQDWPRFRSAMSDYIHLNPQQDEARARLALHHLFNEESPADALKLLDGYEHSELPDIQAALAEAYYRQGKATLSLQAFHRVRAAAPHFVPSYQRLAALNDLTRNLGGVETVLKRLSQLDTDKPYAELALARIQARRGDEQAITPPDVDGLDGADPELLRTRFDLALFSGDIGQAGQHARALWESEQSHPALITYARALKLQGEHQAVIELLESNRERYPDNVFLLDELVECYAAIGADDKKTETLERLAELQPDDPIVLNNLAWAIKESDPARAEDVARKALALSPESSEIIDTLSAILADNAKLPEAIELASTAMENSDRPDKLAVRHVELLLIAGEAGPALDALQAIDPTDMRPAMRERVMLLLHTMRN